MVSYTFSLVKYSYSLLVNSKISKNIMDILTHSLFHLVIAQNKAYWYNVILSEYKEKDTSIEQSIIPKDNLGGKAKRQKYWLNLSGTPGSTIILVKFLTQYTLWIAMLSSFIIHHCDSKFWSAFVVCMWMRAGEAVKQSVSIFWMWVLESVRALICCCYRYMFKLCIFFVFFLQ
jgi:hypothetical protein